MTPAEIAALLGLNLALSLGVMAVLWASVTRSGRVGLLDGVWPLAMAGLAVLPFALTHGDPVRKGLLLWLVALWALPQAWRRLTPAARAEADEGYTRTVEALATDRGWAPSRIRLGLFFLPQAVLAWLAALPVQLGQVDFMPPVGWIGWTGAVVAVVGIGVEGVGSLRTAPSGEDRPLTGLRRWLRRPDCVGDLAVWWGLFLIAAETGPGRASVLGPIFLTWALAHRVRTENPRRVSDGG